MDEFYTADKTRIRVSSFVSEILNHDAIAFGFVKSDNKPNLNAILNKLFPTLLEIKKMEREKLLNTAEEFNETDAEKFCKLADMIFDNIYFSDVELKELDASIWIRPNIETRATFDEIVKSELPKAAVELSVYLRQLLNRYVRMPQYKRESIVFENELSDYTRASNSGHIIHFRYNGIRKKVFPFHYMYGYFYDQSNYLIGYDIDEKTVCAFPLCEVSHTKVTRTAFHPSKKLIECLSEYSENYDYQSKIKFEENN